MAEDRPISVRLTVRYDGPEGRRERRFEKLDAAGRWARAWIGDHPLIERGVATNGRGRITADGAPVRLLFPDPRLGSR